jgi:hypothetical protein
MNDRGESFLLSVVRKSTVFLNLDVQPGSVDSLSHGGDMEPGLLENEAEKVPVFVSEDTDFHVVFIEDE